MSPSDWRSATVVSVPEAAQILGVSRSSAYAAVQRGDLPVIQIGRRLIVPVTRLREMIGEISASDEARS